MARRKNTKPTNIYWLFDTRTGVPFYCGKTVDTPRTRLTHHFDEAARAPRRPVLCRLLELGRDNVRIEVVETVPVGSEWGVRETHWIAALRAVNPDCVNVSSGGAGTPGFIPSIATRQRMSVAQQGRTHSPEACAKISAATGQRMQRPEQRDRISTALKGRTYSDETLAKMSAGQKKRFAQQPLVHSAETRAKMSASARRRRLLAEV